MKVSDIILRWAPVGFLITLLVVFGWSAPRFLTMTHLTAILGQSAWLVVAASGVNFALLSGGVDLSVGSTMYLSAVLAGLWLTGAAPGTCLLGSLVIGGLFGAINGALIVRFSLPGFIVTLATLFVGRGLGLLASSTQVVYANPGVASLGRHAVLGTPVPLWFAAAATALAWLIVNRTPFGPYVRSLGADREGARRVGVPTRSVNFAVYALSGAFAGMAGFISLSQTAAASSAFGENAEFLAIAAAVLGGTSLFGGRGHVWAPVIGSLVIVTVQNGLVMMNANPYLYPVITGAVIFLAAVFDSLRLKLQGRQARASRAQVRASRAKPVAIDRGI